MTKLALVTGGTGRGIGRSIALALARDGYDVALTYRSGEEAAKGVVEILRGMGRRAEAFRSDLFSLADCAALIPAVLAAFGRLDALIIGPGADWHPESPEQLDPQAALQDALQEIEPVLALVPGAIAAMKESGGGRIVGIASNERIPSPSYAYNTAKKARVGALLGLVDTCWTHRITVNAVSPGPVDPIGDLAAARRFNDDFHTSPAEITPQDVAEIVSFLCSEKGRYVTGNIIGTYF